VPVSLAELQTPVSRESVRELILELLETAEFPVEAWQDEGAARMIVEVGAALGAQQSDPVATLAKMVFVATSVGEFLDAVVKSKYDEDRNPSVASVFDVTLENSGSTTHVKGVAEIILRASNGELFSCTEGATVTAGADTVVEFQAQAAGAAGNIVAQDLELVTPLAGVVATFDGTFTTVGADAEGDPQYRSRATAKWPTLQAESIDAALEYRIRTAVPGIFHVGFDSDNPRGPGTTDVYLAGENATAGGSDVTAAQDVLDLHAFGNGSLEKQVKAIAAPTVTQDIAATVYVSGITSDEAETTLDGLWRDFLTTIPIGGFDLSPGPTHTIELSQIDAALQFDGRVSITFATPSAAVAVPLNTKVLEGAIAWTIVQVAV
jgi:uncharacterized phage protein gp47/JayE